MDRRIFFDAVRGSIFRGRMSQDQVDGCNAILDAFDGYPLEYTAYGLATAYHETARTMQPIKEYGGRAYFMRMYDITGRRPHVARALGNTKPGDGATFAGRGYVQLTGRRNYRKAGGKLNLNFLANPGLVMRPDLAAQIMVAGMVEGWFTSRKLSHYFNKSKSDPVNARRIINGMDKARTIAGYHRAFLSALRAAEKSTSPIQAPSPNKPPEPAAEAAKEVVGPVAVGGGAVVAVQEGGAWGWYIAAAIVAVGAVALGYFAYRKYRPEIDGWIGRRVVDVKRAATAIRISVKDRFS